jgi:hypothetical protein
MVLNPLDFILLVFSLIALCFCFITAGCSSADSTAEKVIIGGSPWPLTLEYDQSYEKSKTK